jgi:hypothetical protein
MEFEQDMLGLLRSARLDAGQYNEGSLVLHLMENKVKKIIILTPLLIVPSVWLVV